MFGPCDPCDGSLSISTIGETQNIFQVSIKDDDDLEFDHEFIVRASSADISILPLQFNITDDGTCVSHSLTQKIVSLYFSQSNRQLA